MYCEKCGNQINSGEIYCKICHHSSEDVEVLTPEEKNSFQGMTIEAVDNDTNERYQDEHRTTEERIYFKQTHLNLSGVSLLTKLVIAALLVFMVFVALPIFLLILSIILIGWLLLRNFK
ncbi:hypothetical protein HA075_15695 [bacterium BFN5]|nr:hypothetical protein HA075_15695 [bacterium BFN5]